VTFPSKPLAILGATSHIAKDFVVNAHRNFGTTFSLYGRRPGVVADFISRHNFPRDWDVGTFSDFAAETNKRVGRFGAILNFVGVGDPAKAKEMGAEIFSATWDSDQHALLYLERFPETPYIFASSGAVYGSDFNAPVTESSVATVPVNTLAPESYYGVAKLYAEARHRAIKNRTILDVRIFNYVSRTLDIDARFLITDIIAAIAGGELFRTTNQHMLRDYLHPEDFCSLVMACIAAPPGTNMPVDAYSRAPISKSELLTLSKDKFGLQFEFVDRAPTLNATGAKPFYYSENRVAETLGYRPRYSSAEGIAVEVSAILEQLQKL
jgi:nucleoside-diphosphate-sugar epimerase